MSELIREIEQEIRELEATEIHVETNQGTYGPHEACQKVGTSEPRFANREVYETVGGTRRETGPGEDRTPGYMRRINAEEMKDLRAKVKALRQRATELRRGVAK